MYPVPNNLLSLTFVLSWVVAPTQVIEYDVRITISCGLAVNGWKPLRRHYVIANVRRRKGSNVDSILA